jgi:hypothetical protein
VVSIRRLYRESFFTASPTFQTPSKLGAVQQPEADPLLQLIGSLSVDIPDLAENHDYYIGQALYRELKGVE